MMTTSSHTPPIARRKSDGAISSVKLWLKPDRCPSLSRFRRKNLLPTLRKIAAEVYSNARLQDRYLCSQNPLLPSFSFSFIREKNVAPYLQYLFLSTVYLVWGRWGSFVCGKNRTWQANHVLPLVLLMSHDLGRQFRALFAWFHSFCFGVKQGFGVVSCWRLCWIIAVCSP